jgi:hypothetical protein
MSPESGARTAETTGAGSEAHTHEHKGCWCCEVNDAMNKFAREFGPSDEVRSHFRNSRVEFLKGIRRIIDERISRLSENEQKGSKVTVE